MQLNSTTMRPPEVSSAEFKADIEYTLAFGRNNSTERTAYQTDTAKFWYDEDPGEAVCQDHILQREVSTLICIVCKYVRLLLDTQAA